MADIDLRGTPVSLVLGEATGLVQFRTHEHLVTLHFNQLEEIYLLAKIRKESKEKPSYMREPPKIKESPENANSPRKSGLCP